MNVPGVPEWFDECENDVNHMLWPSMADAMSLTVLSTITRGPGVFQGVCSEDGFSSLGGASFSSLIDSTNPELVQSSFL